jgi:HSP20 family protein
MSNLLSQRESPSLRPDMLERFTSFPFWVGSMSEGQVMRLEDEMKDGRYIVRAELPGIDPAKDVDITVANGRLTIKAERSETAGSQKRSEFSYGLFARCVALPPGADADDITATYDKGILTVSVGIPQRIQSTEEKHIPVQAMK